MELRLIQVLILLLSQVVWAQTPQLKVLTQNLWGLPVSVVDKADRIEQFCKTLTDRVDQGLAWDVVYIQEAWMLKDRETLHHCGYPFVADLDQFSLSSGVMILSQFPIKQEFFFHFHETHDPGTLDAEIFVRKGALFALIEHPSLGLIWLVDTHTASPYAKHTNAQTRLAQLTEVSNWMQMLDPKIPVVFGGDLNIGEGIAEDIAWEHMSELFPQFSEMQYGPDICTYCDSNFYATENLGKIDHLFSYGMAATEGQVVLEQVFKSLSGKDMHYSDHYALETTFVLE